MLTRQKLFSLFAAAMLIVINANLSIAQSAVNLQGFNKKSGVTVKATGTTIDLSWPTGTAEHGRVVFDLDKSKPLFKSIQANDKGAYKEVAANLDPEFILTIGKRDLISQNGWNIFFDRVPLKPFKAYRVKLDKKSASVKTDGSRTIVSISGVKASTFTGHIEVTFYNNSPLFNVAAVMATDVDSTAIVYDAGLVSAKPAWSKIDWAKTNDEFNTTAITTVDTAKNVAVKYRTIIGQTVGGSLAIFPAPHQYFYPLDEAFNLKFTWYGTNYRNMLPGYGIGIRQDLYGDHRYVPWFNAPPGTQQRLNFFCMVSLADGSNTLEKTKQFTHGDKFIPLPGYRTMASHFHNEYTQQLLKGKGEAGEPEYISVFKSLGVNIVHLAEFHGTGHPKGPDSLRLKELNTLFKECEKESGKNFMLLPGEEPNEFFGGHWLEFFPKPIYWVMSRKDDVPFSEQNSQYGKVYHIRDKGDMLQLLEWENGLAWTAHARTKGSTGYPDLYKDEKFYKSDHFNGAAWKNIPADLSTERMGKRVFDLMDDMSNWGLKKKVLAESDIFSITHENEMYAHVNINYLKLNTLPEFKNGWQPILDVLKSGNFFSTTGEILIPTFKVNGVEAGSTIETNQNTKPVFVDFSVKWTFPLNFAELVTGDGKNVYRQRINLKNTTAFGEQSFHIPVNLRGKKWIRLEVWDAAVNGAFTQTVWIDQKFLITTD